MKVTVQRNVLPKRLRPNRRMRRVPPLPENVTTTWLKIYLQQFLSPGTSCLAIRKKLQRVPKGKKITIWRDRASISPVKAGKMELKDSRGLTKVEIIHWAKSQGEAIPKDQFQRDLGLSCEKQNVKTCRRKHGEHILDLRLGKEFLRHKSTNYRRKDW